MLDLIIIKKNNFKTKNTILSIVIITIFSIVFFSCENSIKQINSITERVIFPNQTAKNITVLRSDSGLIVARIHADEIKVYTDIKEPYTIFPKGLKVETYEKYPKIESSISAKFAIYYKEKKLWIARNDVKAENSKGEKLNTEKLFWDELNKKIYSDKFSKITTEDGVLYGKNGFTADQNFTKWKLINTEGTVNVKDEQK